MKNKVSCIIPAYNEEKTIGNVLKVMEHHPLVYETIVIDDGSSDNTKKIVKKYKNVKLLVNKKNIGKTHSLLRGINYAKKDIVMLIDSDLIGLSKKDITNLISPIIKNYADVSISIRENSYKIFKLMGLDFVSGERAFSKKILGDINQFKKLPNFGFESYLNKEIIKKNLRIKIVPFPNVSHIRKTKKRGFITGTIHDYSMTFDIIKTLGIFGVINQIIKMRSLRV
ncbi:glycosyl transferase [Candidatus Pacearchaeota archaeon CG10_big_fil_rev_8_21_14_0_10_30_48]|nr:MAG: glycosyl transferase [Candidatus Pacearchaeota archaeon CG10_big_fil_rev_8_21_14_0_10_30_48]